MVIQPYGIDTNNVNTFLNLIVSTNSKTTHVEVKGPSYNKKDNFINWGLWLPYREIAEASDQLVPYLKYFFDAAVIVFKNYGVKEEDVRKVQRVVEEEVIDNPKYTFVEEQTPQPDLSDLGL
jgi:hypothetical protein